jgi:hypothetical protein
MTREVPRSARNDKLMTEHSFHFSLLYFQTRLRWRTAFQAVLADTLPACRYLEEHGLEARAPGQARCLSSTHPARANLINL